jgi:hypothetical protein
VAATATTLGWVSRSHQPSSRSVIRAWQTRVCAVVQSSAVACVAAGRVTAAVAARPCSVVPRAVAVAHAVALVHRPAHPRVHNAHAGL